MATWKWIYYAPSLIKERHNARLRLQKGSFEKPLSFFSPALWLPWTGPGRKLWFEAWGPYFVWNFALLPLAFLPLGRWAAVSVLINLAAAEIFSNVYSFIMIVPNHGGGDLYRFERPPAGRREFYIRQIMGSANFATGSDRVDFLHGYLNHQIEHHLWPDLPMIRYARLRPRVKALCAGRGLPYVDEPVNRRMRKLMDVLTGRTAMRIWSRSGS
jgi:fatty acid desaturase